MILPIVAYGAPVLKQRAKPIEADYKNLQALISNMWETMYAAQGVGLAAPQIGLSIRLFVIDTAPFAADDSLTAEERTALEMFKEVFINATILDETGEAWDFNEGCLSIPDIREDVLRNETIQIHYWDQDFKEHTRTFEGLIARVVQHEYDHIEGILFTDKLSPLKKRLIKRKLTAISQGKIHSEYPMRFPQTKRKR